MLELLYGAASDAGPREHNEDAWLTRPPVFVVADGMGGHQGGRAASQIVVEEFAALGGSQDLTCAEVEQVLHRCQGRIGAVSDHHPELPHAGTTVVGCVLVTGHRREPHWLVVNVGDSRAYRFARGRLERISVDHSVVQELIDSGEITQAEAGVHPERNVVTRVLGSPDSAQADYFLLALASTPRILLCSDGVCGTLEDHQMAAVLAAYDDPAEAAEQLVAISLAAGTGDNSTAVVVDVVGWPHQRHDDAHRSVRPLVQPDEETLSHPRAPLVQHHH